MTTLALLTTCTAVWTLHGDDPRVSGRARTAVRTALGNLPQPLVNDATIVASELVTNAARYTRSADPGGLVALAGPTVKISVLDEGAVGGAVPTCSPADRLNSGWGLSMCAELGALTVQPVAAGHLVSVALDVLEAAR
ncbi:MAG: ATP-binding protein [Arthrobacter sp.]|uniref:ATP-binding protein n=1 Tax=Arthrobacter sp. TaxID=1667 RepID=UPI00347D0CF7